MNAQTNECTKREFEKNFWGSHKLPQALEKVCDENESRRIIIIRKKRRARKNVFDGRREFIGRLWKSSMINRKEPQVDDC